MRGRGRRPEARWAATWASWLGAQVGPSQVVLRLIVFAAGTCAAFLTRTASPIGVRDSFFMVTMLIALWAAVLPAGVAPAVLLGSLVGWWMFVGAGAPLGMAAGVALLLAVAHRAAATAATGPRHGAMTRRAAGAFVRRGAGYVGVVAAAGVLVLAVAALPDAVPRGRVWLVAILVALLAGAAAVALRRPAD